MGANGNDGRQSVTLRAVGAAIAHGCSFGKALEVDDRCLQKSSAFEFVGFSGGYSTGKSRAHSYGIEMGFWEIEQRWRVGNVTYADVYFCLADLIDAAVEAIELDVRRVVVLLGGVREMPVDAIDLNVLQFVAS